MREDVVSGTIVITQSGAQAEVMTREYSSASGGPINAEAPMTVERLYRLAALLARKLRLKYEDPVMEAKRISGQDQADTFVRETVESIIKEQLDG